jgi:hypothetical protein
VYNIKKAVSRLQFAPKIDDIKVTDIKRGLGSFTPKPDKPVSFAALKSALKKAGYTLASAEITVSGKVVRDQSGWWIEAQHSGQRFQVIGDSVTQSLEPAAGSERVELTGAWQTVNEASGAREVITYHEIKVEQRGKNKSGGVAEKNGEAIQVSINGVNSFGKMLPAPVRTTSPGLTVYKGGAITPRYFFIKQHLGNLEVNRHSVRVSVSYTPTPTVQLEAEVPFQRTSFDDGAGSGSGNGLGNITVWGKYRFYRELETWGDRQAALRFGLELPTGKKLAPGEDKLDRREFVRQQLSAINGGLAFRTDLSYSQARGRFIFGANIEGTLRSERDGFRTGHELRLNTDLEYVLLPRKYQTPGHELFAILETTYSFRDRGRVGGRTAPGSSASEFYLAPGVQYTATPRVVLEASFQFPVVLNAGPLVLRTDTNFLAGIRYLY